MPLKSARVTDNCHKLFQGDFIMKRNTLLIGLLALALLLAACSGNNAANQPDPNDVTETAEPQSLRIAILPILDALPLHVAQAQ
jgi:ABC-type nitrate/sulfonate/bicarbonate transport system substrate-binding protein